MDIEEIQKYIEDNNITFDFENRIPLIDYVDCLPRVSNDKMKKLVDEFSKVAKESGSKMLIVDSLNGDLKEI